MWWFSAVQRRGAASPARWRRSARRSRFVWRRSWGPRNSRLGWWRISARHGGIPAAEEAAREWNVVMGLLNEMAHLLGEQTVTVAEYEDLFGLLLR